MGSAMDAHIGRHKTPRRFVALCVGGALAAGLAACGGGNPAAPAAPGSEGAQQLDRAVILADAASGFVCAPQALACVQVQSTAQGEQASVPVTFGQPFRAGDVPSGTRFVADDGTGRVSVQADAASTRVGAALSVCRVAVKAPRPGSRVVMPRVS